MKHRSVALVLALMLGLTFSTGCMGRNALTKRVLDWNLAQSKEKWPRQGYFTALTIIPVYFFAQMADGLVFNTIEFWTDENSLSGEKALVLTDAREVVTPDGQRLVMTPEADNTLRLDIHGVDGSVRSLRLADEQGDWIARDLDGHRVGRVDDNGWLVFDAFQLVPEAG